MWKTFSASASAVRLRFSSTPRSVSSPARCCRLLHVCIVGSGPAGLYTAEKLLKLSAEAKIDVFDRLPSPFGLVRSGVAPDHQETKIVTNQFTKVLSSPRLAFFGNVCVGKDIDLIELRKLYDVVVLAYGSESDNSLGIPGEDLYGVFSAREFVWWYNAHPDCANLDVDLCASDTAIILGQGNVAIDVARILLRRVEDLKSTDIAHHALRTLNKSSIKKVYLIGRRGPAQISCTAKELREVLGLKGVNVVVRSSDLALSEIDVQEINASRIHKRVYELLSKAAMNGKHSLESYEKELHFVFYRQPTEFLPTKDGHHVSGLRLEKTILEKEAGSIRQRAVGTSVFENLSSSLILKSIGYKSLPLDNLSFDHRKGLIPNLNGRVLRVVSKDGDPECEPGLYVVGWLKRGPTGIIGTNLICAEEVTMSIIKDVESGILSNDPSHEGREGVTVLLRQRGVKFISFKDWEKINAFEIMEGAKKGKPREKLISVEEAVKVVGIS